MRSTPAVFRGEVLIDGYNLLHAAGLARRSYGPGEFERTRQRLLKLLAGQLFPRERQRTTVVFDAPEQSLGPSPPTLVHGLRVIYASGEGDADAVIERLIASNSAPRRLHVVSSDHRIQRAARRRRARFFDSDQFLERIARRRGPAERARQAEPREKQQGLTAPGEVEAWMKAFGDVGPIAEDATPQPRAAGPHPEKGRPPRDETAPAAPPERGRSSRRKPASGRAETGEIAFWEQRIAELWQQTESENRTPER